MPASPAYQSSLAWDSERPKTLVIADLRRAASLLHEMFENVAVETYFARLDDGDARTVVFEAV